jgi:hypothetical protein
VHGPAASRGYALLNLLGSAGRVGLAVLLLRLPGTRDRDRLRWRVRELRGDVPVHLAALRGRLR